jgi:TRAP-type C4-dicarboxylate transport system permease small subunit
LSSTAAHRLAQRGIKEEPTVRERLHKLIEQISTALAWVAYIIIVLMALHITSSVVLRWVTGRDIPVTTETATYYYMVALTFLPLAFVEMKNKHLNAEFLYALFPSRIQKVITLLTTLLMLTYIAFLSFRTLINAMERTRSEEVISTATGLYAIWPARWILPISLAITVLFVVSRLIRDLFGPADDPESALENSNSNTQGGE